METRSAPLWINAWRLSVITLDQLTADVRFIAVQLEDVPNPMWLPGDARVYIEIYDELRNNLQKFRNVHHYTNYRRYRVSAKIGAPH